MCKTMEQSFIAYIENSIKNNWDLDALTDYKGATLQYKDVARKIEKLHIIHCTNNASSTNSFPLLSLHFQKIFTLNSSFLI